MARVAAIQKKEAPKKSFSNGRSLPESFRQEVERLAYQLYLERGGQHGSDREDWLRAEQIVLSRRS